MNTPDYLNRYTTLPFLLNALRERRLQLRPPESWDDRNDSHYLERYGEEKALKTLQLLCFTMCRERFHHWKCFADGPSGVCIEFRREPLLRRIRHDPDFRAANVRYEQVKRVEGHRPDLENWPFLKRVPFQDENEFRILFQSERAADDRGILPFEYSYIRRITLSPWLAKPVAQSVIATLKSIPGCAHLKVSRSTLFENTRWRTAIA